MWASEQHWGPAISTETFCRLQTIPHTACSWRAEETVLSRTLRRSVAASHREAAPRACRQPPICLLSRDTLLGIRCGFQTSQRSQTFCRVPVACVDTTSPVSCVLYRHAAVLHRPRAVALCDKFSPRLLWLDSLVVVDNVQPQHAGKSLAAACSLQAAASVATPARGILRCSAAVRQGDSHDGRCGWKAGRGRPRSGVWHFPPPRFRRDAWLVTPDRPSGSILRSGFVGVAGSGEGPSSPAPRVMGRDGSIELLDPQELKASPGEAGRGPWPGPWNPSTEEPQTITGTLDSWAAIGALPRNHASEGSWESLKFGCRRAARRVE